MESRSLGRSLVPKQKQTVKHKQRKLACACFSLCFITNKNHLRLFGDANVYSRGNSTIIIIIIIIGCAIGFL